MDDVIALIRDVPDFPKPGIVFKDLTPLFGHSAAMQRVSVALVEPFKDQGITAVAGMEARGFIFGSLAAQELGVGFAPLRKPGKLPAQTFSVSYALEYGEATLEMHCDALTVNDRVLVIDDLLATGGTAAASIDLIGRSGAEIAALGFVVELDFLKGRNALEGQHIHSLIHY